MQLVVTETWQDPICLDPSSCGTPKENQQDNGLVWVAAINRWFSASRLILGVTSHDAVRGAVCPSAIIGRRRHHTWHLSGLLISQESPSLPISSKLDFQRVQSRWLMFQFKCHIWTIHVIWHIIVTIYIWVVITLMISFHCCFSCVRCCTVSNSN